ncbi:MAG: ribosomal protein L3 N(5)-glutamine methyltransferase [Rhizobiales bacterium 65-9]|nr:50S ribosomal protein L3 N(5)-glutamine methyltransferase [Hyphomicrobiales bacterium]OJY35473.1 MAG: ribosomal protein L3 N(5)-glutamine methyltransferase [Rhizobiales bacterium 65-9]
MENATLLTVRDHLRFAVSRFRAADLFHGHGATSAIDEAAFLVLEALHLPVEDINPWLDARLMADERARLLSLIEARVATRKPAAYLLNKTYLQSAPFYVDERVIVPRSYIAELLFRNDVVGGAGALIPQPEEIGSVLDLCTGSGCLAVLATRAFPNARVDAVDLSADALAVARRNIEDYGLSDRISLHQGDLFAPLKGRRYDLIITNPPYVDAETMAMLPPEFQAEPAMALAGGDDGFDVVRRILADAPAHLNEGGGLVCEIGTDRATLEAGYPDTAFLWLDSEDSEGEVFWLGAEQLKAR